MSQNYDQLPPQDRWNAEQQDFQNRSDWEAKQIAQMQEGTKGHLSQSSENFWKSWGPVLTPAIMGLIIGACLLTCVYLSIYVLDLF